MSDHHTINYIELPARDLAATKQFFSTVFAWQFVDYGPDYTAFGTAEAGVDGGFFRADVAGRVEAGAPLVVLYSEDLEASQRAVEAAGGEISTPIFDFPGGRRFHFIEPSGNELAVWAAPVQN